MTSPELAYWRFRAKKLVEEQNGNVFAAFEGYEKTRRGESLFTSLMITTVITYLCYHILWWPVCIAVCLTVFRLSDIMIMRLSRPYGLSTALEEWLNVARMQAAVAAAPSIPVPPPTQ
jgi:hypothetical protein